MYCTPKITEPLRNDAYEKKLMLFLETSNISLFIESVRGYYDNKCKFAGFYFAYQEEIIPNLRTYRTREVIVFSFKALFNDDLRRIDLLFDDNYLKYAIEKHEWDNEAQQFIELPEMYNVELKYSRYVLAG